MSTADALDTVDLEIRVKEMYRRVAEEPGGLYHFEVGRALAERLGYPNADLDRVPAGAVESFAGVGYFFDMAALTTRDRVVDLGSGSGMDSFIAASIVGPTGHVVGVDYTDSQLAKSRSMAGEWGWVDFVEGRIEDAPVIAGVADCVISNGVINLAPDKAAVFAEAARMLRPGGRLAIADIVAGKQLAESIVGNAELWASCIGGAAQEDGYRRAIEDAGFDIVDIRTNPYEFLSDSARGASASYGVKSLSLLAVKA
jgi:SAM-dependent methyltransferase